MYVPYFWHTIWFAPDFQCHIAFPYQIHRGNKKDTTYSPLAAASWSSTGWQEQGHMDLQYVILTPLKHSFQATLMSFSLFLFQSLLLVSAIFSGSMRGLQGSGKGNCHCKGSTVLVRASTQLAAHISYLLIPSTRTHGQLRFRLCSCLVPQSPTSLPTHQAPPRFLPINHAVGFTNLPTRSLFQSFVFKLPNLFPLTNYQ